MRRLWILFLLPWLVPPAWAENTSMGEVVDRTALRVCADPADLPFSNDAEAGYENAIATLLANHLRRPLTYVWYPRTIGFYRQTLRARLCDLVMGVVAAHELVQNTNPYFRSAYVMAVRKEDADELTDLSDPVMKTVTIGVVAGTPPADLLAQHGLLGNIRPYQLQNDSRYASPLKQMADDLEAGLIDVALGWGPPLGYWTGQSRIPIAISALKSGDPHLRMDFRISMGVRWREPDWKHEINQAIADLQPEITRVLQSFNIPLLDDQGNLIEGLAQVSVNQDSKVATIRSLSGIEEPLGYRMEKYRARVPGSLEGGTIVDAVSLQQLIKTQNPVLIDVLPKQRKPKNRNANMPWMEKKRLHIPGSVWLPNTGYGELSAEFAEYFEAKLAALTHGNKSHPLVFYCDKNCWMSYNAAKRAILEYGYSKVFWFPEGADGWKAAGLEMAEGKPLDMPDFLE